MQVSDFDPEDFDQPASASEQQLSAADFDAYVSAPMSDREREEILSLVAWFTRRYPTPSARFRAARKAVDQARVLSGRALTSPARRE